MVFAGAAMAQAPAQPETGSVEQELIKLELGWTEAILKHDIAFLERVYADDLIYTDPNGAVWTGAQDIANIDSGVAVYTAFVTDDMIVHVYGDTAVVFGRDTIKGRVKGQDVSGRYRWTDTWMKKDGRWQCVATQSSKIALSSAIKGE